MISARGLLRAVRLPPTCKPAIIDHRSRSLPSLLLSLPAVAGSGQIQCWLHRARTCMKFTRRGALPKTAFLLRAKIRVRHGKSHALNLRLKPVWNLLQNISPAYRGNFVAEQL